MRQTLKRRALAALVCMLALTFAGCHSAPQEAAEIPSVTALSREEYLAALAETEGLSLEEAEERDRRSEAGTALGEGQTVGYAILSKQAETIEDGDQYSQPVYLTALAKYVRDDTAGGAAAFLDFHPKGVELPGVDPADFTFQHGEEEIRRPDEKRAVYIAIGQFRCPVPDVGPAVRESGDIAALYSSGGKTMFLTNPITIHVTFGLDDLA